VAEEIITNEGTDISEKNIVDAPAQSTSKAVTVKADASLLKEYVAATDTTWSPWTANAYIRSLPNPIDDLMRDFGSRLYDIDMPRDPQVYSTLSILVMAILCQDMRLVPAVDKNTPKYDQAKKVFDFCMYCIDNLKHSFPEILYELTESTLKMGHKVGEMIYEQRNVRDQGVRIVLTDIKTKANEATAFIVDPYMNVLGLTYVRPGRSMPALNAYTKPPETKNSDGSPFMIPRAKFVIPVHKPRNGDPRGTSHIRAAYTPWWKKQSWNPQHLAYVTRFAQPSVIAKLPKEARDIPVVDTTTGLTTATKSIIGQTNVALAKIKGGAVGSFIDTDVMLLEASGVGDVIFESYRHEDHQIAKAILMQTLTTEESAHMARAASSVHQDVFGILIAFLRSMLEWTVQNDILKTLVRYNFGEEASQDLVPVVSFGDTQAQDIPKLMSSIAQLALANGIHWSMWPAIRPILGLPPANEEEEAKDLEATRAKQEADLEAAKVASKQAVTNPAAQNGDGTVKSVDPKPVKKPNNPQTAPKKGN
jgi:hypothetical protein